MMDNISLVSDFEKEQLQDRYYKKLDIPGLPPSYQLYSGGTYFFLSNEKHRTIRFSAGGINAATLDAEKVEQLLSRLRRLYPGF